MLRLALTLACLVLGSIAVPVVTWAALAAAETPLVKDLHELLEPGRHRLSLDIDGHERKVIFVTPSGVKKGERLPIVFFLHGAGGSAQQASHTYGWAEKAEEENFFVAFAEGLPARPDEPGSFFLNPHIWRDLRPGMPTHGVDDVHFFTELLDRLAAAVPIDPKRVYVTGFSNGAGMTFTLGGHFPQRIAAIAPVSSQSFAEVMDLARPLPVYYLVGTADPLIPYHGGTVTLPWGNTRTTPAVQESADKWARLDGCAPEPHVLSEAKGVRVVRYGPGREGAEVIYTTVEGNGHHWPDTVEPLPHAISGPSLDPFNATDRIWNFFQAHPLP